MQILAANYAAPRQELSYPVVLIGGSFDVAQTNLVCMIAAHLILQTSPSTWGCLDGEIDAGGSSFACDQPANLA